MSKILTLSKFFYGTTVTAQNRSIDFDEGGIEIKATLKVGAYSLTEYALEIQRAMREAGTQLYIVTLIRATQKITVSAPLVFKFRTITGTRVLTSAFNMMGFTSAVQQSGLNTYTGLTTAGESYTTQFPVDEYVAVEDSIVKENSTVNSTPAGIVQQVSFGNGARIEMNIRLITNNLNIKNKPFYANPTGVQDIRVFMFFLLKKGRVEFMPDKDLATVFTKCFLEGTKEDREAKRFELKNMKTPDIYETGKLIFRKVLI